MGLYEVRLSMSLLGFRMGTIVLFCKFILPVCGILEQS